MKQSEIIKILSLETGAHDIDSINEVLKSKKFDTKFRITGPGVVHFGFTGFIKAVTKDGVKVYNVNKVNLIRFDDIETFSKAKPKMLRPDPKQKNPIQDEDEEDFENDDDFDAYADEDDDIIENEKFKTQLKVSKKKKPKLTEHKKGSGSLFIPKKK